MARECLDLGFFISLAGPVTFKNARRPREGAVKAPLEWLLVETDSPYLAPDPFRGQRNEPYLVREVAGMIAALRGMDYQQLAMQTFANACRAFGIEKGFCAPDGEYTL